MTGFQNSDPGLNIFEYLVQPILDTKPFNITVQGLPLSEAKGKLSATRRNGQSL